ncbi:PREDICTED: tRNA methyltransferase 10 homolog A-like [Priapulus caudatus]|uniref:tRNA (guanine(9)-N(1))-methyltransferase n=1 Tax=Priapulus caudatus TaxID=37621 RepID=A0ABM1EZ91_PRICU|nr:PREDICTED: tRNA methyltransferase 10 homolog A-like [Priapulus caudatus]
MKADIEVAVEDSEQNASLSKNQRKKLEKRMRLQASRTEKRKEEKQRKKNRRAEQLAAGIEIPPPKRWKKMEASNCAIQVAVDMSFDHLMSDKDLAKALHQLQFCYSVNRRAENPLQFHITGLSGRCAAEMERKAGNGYSNWDAHRHEQRYLEVFARTNVVYLSSESPNVLSRLDAGAVYVIGGLVDHNQHKVRWRHLRAASDAIFFLLAFL